MKKFLLVLIAIITASIYIPVFADDEPTNPINEPIEFGGELIENTATTATGAVVGTAQTLGDIAGRAGEEENKN